MKKSKRRTSLKHEELCFYSESFVNYSNLSNTNQIHALKKSLFENSEYLLGLLTSLDGIVQSPKYHPESDALYHTLQVFEQAYQDSTDPELLLAALFHDVGKSIDSKRHAKIGAEMISDFFPYRVVWLVEHHLDLMVSPRKTQQRLANSLQLKDLVKLRAWDLGGRSPTANVCTPSEALDIIYSLVSKQV